jgi:3'-5' exoribonuclease
METLVKTKVENLQQGNRVFLEGEFSKLSKKTKGGKGDPYFVATIKDNSGMASQQVWNNLPLYPVIEGIENGQWVRADVTCAKVGQYINVDIHSIEIIERVVDAVVSIEALQTELREEFKSFRDEDLRKLVTNVFNRPDVKEAFWTAPASQKSGYSHDSGLATHVVRLIRLSKAVANVFNQWNHYLDGRHTKLNEDLLKASCILHDIGKVKTFKKNAFNVDKTDEGKLFEDSYLSMKIVLEELPKVNLPEYQQMMLEHVLGGAKGQRNFGALHIPRSREAMAFHFIDALDVQMANFEHLDRDADVADLFSMLFEKQIFLGVYDEE